MDLCDDFKNDLSTQPQPPYYIASAYQDAPYFTFDGFNEMQYTVPISCEYHRNPVLGISIPSPMSSDDTNACTYIPPAQIPFEALVQSPPCFFPSFNPLSQSNSLSTNSPAMPSPIHHVILQFCQLPPHQQKLLLKHVRHPQDLEQQDPIALQAAINLVMQCSAADDAGGSYTIPQQIEDTLMRRVPRPPAETGFGSRQGCMHWACRWPGCEKETKRRPNATRHLLSHTGAKPEICPVCQNQFRFPQDLQRHRKIKHLVGLKMVNKDHPGGVLCEDPGDSFEPLGLTFSIGTAVTTLPMDPLWQTGILRIFTKDILHCVFSFLYITASTPLKYARNTTTCLSPTHYTLQRIPRSDIRT